MLFLGGNHNANANMQVGSKYIANVNRWTIFHCCFPLVLFAQGENHTPWIRILYTKCTFLVFNRSTAIYSEEKWFYKKSLDFEQRVELFDFEGIPEIHVYRTCDFFIVTFKSLELWEDIRKKPWSFNLKNFIIRRIHRVRCNRRDKNEMKLRHVVFRAPGVFEVNSWRCC